MGRPRGNSQPPHPVGDPRPNLPVHLPRKTRVEGGRNGQRRRPQGPTPRYDEKKEKEGLRKVGCLKRTLKTPTHFNFTPNELNR